VRTRSNFPQSTAHGGIHNASLDQKVAIPSFQRSAAADRRG
jgi:hypothetical protein